VGGRAGFDRGTVRDGRRAAGSTERHWGCQYMREHNVPPRNEHPCPAPPPPPPRGEGREDGFSRLDEGKGGGQLPIANPLANFLVNSPSERLKTVVKIHGEGILCGVKEPFELRFTTNAFAIPPPSRGVVY